MKLNGNLVNILCGQKRNNENQLKEEDKEDWLPFIRILDFFYFDLKW